MPTRQWTWSGWTTSLTPDDTYCLIHGIRHCTICNPPSWLFPSRTSDEAVSEA
jgi:hypothetical protein